MNREIKFRGKGYSEWFYGYVQEYHEKFCKRICVCPVSIRTWKDALMYEVKEETIGQFTGLHDKNGKEIYEGDILRVICRGNEFACLVGWNYEIGAWCISIGDTYVGVKPLGGWLCDGQFEVIGNIHDNPELLEE